MALLSLGPRLFPDQWFTRGIADYGQSQCTVVTGFVLVVMVDPAYRSGAANSLTFGIVAAVVIVVFIVWGLARGRSARAAQ